MTRILGFHSSSRLAHITYSTVLKVDNIPQSEKLRFSSANPFTPTYVASNLSLSSDPMGMYNTRVKGRQILLENPARESRAKKELEAKRAAKKKEKERKNLGIIGKKEAKEKGVWKFDESQAK